MTDTHCSLCSKPLTVHWAARELVVVCKSCMKKLKEESVQRKKNGQIQ